MGLAFSLALSLRASLQRSLEFDFFIIFEMAFQTAQNAYIHYLHLPPRLFQINKHPLSRTLLPGFIIIDIMLSGMRDHESTLADSERFYYSNYEYYNTYEQLDEYQNDLSKIRFNLRRKSRGAIVLYDTHSSSYSEQPHQRLLKECNPKPTHHCPHIREQYTTLDDLLFRFATAFHQHNYADLRSDRQNCKDNFDLIILKYMYSFFEAQFETTEQECFTQLAEILNQLNEQGAGVRTKLEALYQREGRAQSTELLERWFAFEQYWHYLLQEKLIAQSKDEKVENFYLFQFCQYFRYFLNQVAGGSMRNILLLAQPETPTLTQLIHPLSIPLTYALKAKNDPPRILFLNLDGRETYLNLRVIQGLPETVRYISVFEEPSGLTLSQTTLQKGCAEFQTEADIVNMNSAHSELLFRAIRREGEAPSENILLYPLNSLYLRHAYSHSRIDRPLHQRKLPILEHCDLRWLWQQVISSQAQEWSPDLTIVSYNGSLDLPQQDFAEILRDLTALSDHRVLLFANMTGLFKGGQEAAMDEEENEAYPRDKVELVKEFLGHYVPYRYENVDEERYFNNLSQFVKITSGAISLKKSTQHTPHGRFALGNRLLYLQRLSQLPSYAQLLQAGSQASNLDRLFKEFARREIEQNRKENQWWSKKIDQAEARLMEMNVEAELEAVEQEEEIQERRLQRQSTRQVAYRIKALRHELEAQQLMVHGEMDTQAQFESYLQRKKERLLLENLETYHYRRVYTGEEEQRGGRLRCYRFSLSDGQGEGEEILLQRYSQVITDEKKTRIFIVNYRLEEDRHVILQGDIMERGNCVRMKRAILKLETEFQDISLGSRSEKINVNYSYCFAKDKLYLFWPQRWDIDEEIRRKLLGLEYNPPHVNDMLRLSYNSQERAYIVERLKCNQTQGIPSVPRRGCVGLDIGSGDTRFYILGGVYDSRLDYYSGAAGVNLAVVQDDTFSIQAAPKRRDRLNSRNSYLKPKMNYRVEKSSRTAEEGGSILLSGGYGRSFTNFHSLFSQESYSVANQLDGLKITRIQSKNPRVTRLSQPIPVAAVGRFLVGSQGEGEERFSDAVKDWILGQGRDERAGEREVLSVLQEQMRVRQFKSDHKRNYLFGWDRIIRQRIYVPHCWSPELQILANGRLFLVYTALKTQKSNNYNIGNFLIPKEEDLASLHLDEDRLLLLSNSPVLHSLDNKPNNYILYEGSLANINDLATRRELPMAERHEFKVGSKQQQSLKYKTVFTVDDRIFVLGGLRKELNQREDYLLERHKDKLKCKTRRLECNQDSLELTSPVVVKHKDGFLLYSVILEQKPISKDENTHFIEDFWRLKIQTFSPNQSCQEETMHSGPLLLYHLDFETGKMVSRRPQFQQPKIVKIIPYTRFSSSALRQVMEKVYVKVNRLEEERFQQFLEVLRAFVRQREEERLTALLQEHHHRGTAFKNFLALFDFLLDNQRRERDNLENEELVRDLRSMTSLMNKHFIESILEPQGESVLHRFVMEDRSSRKVKFVAIGPLLTTRLRFLRIRYRHELSICLNETIEQELFFNTNIVACQEIAKEKLKGSAVELEEEPIVRKITVSYPPYRP